MSLSDFGIAPYVNRLRNQGMPRAAQEAHEIYKMLMELPGNDRRTYRSWRRSQEQVKAALRVVEPLDTRIS